MNYNNNHFEKLLTKLIKFLSGEIIKSSYIYRPLKIIFIKEMLNIRYKIMLLVRVEMIHKIVCTGKQLSASSHGFFSQLSIKIVNNFNWKRNYLCYQK